MLPKLHDDESSPVESSLTRWSDTNKAITPRPIATAFSRSLTPTQEFELSETPLDTGVYKCAHGVWLYTQCHRCGRGPDEALRYAYGMKVKIEELLGQLGGK